MKKIPRATNPWRSTLLLVVSAAILTACSQPSTPSTGLSAPAPAPAEPATPPQAMPPAPEPIKAPEPPPQPKVAWVVKTKFGPIVSDDPAANGKNVVLLTFDDGPHPEYTEQVLAVLKKENVKALWFVTAAAEKYPELIKKIDAEGHLVGTHTMYHENLRMMSKEKQREAIAGVNGIVEKITGKKPKYFRPPFGAYNDATLEIMQEMGMQLMNWDHGSGDWMEVKDGYKDPKVVIQDVLSEKPRNNQMTPLHPGSIILFHDTLRHTAEALPEILTGLKEKSYEVVIPQP